MQLLQSIGIVAIEMPISRKLRTTKNGHIDKKLFLGQTIFAEAGEANRINTNTLCYEVERVARYSPKREWVRVCVVERERVREKDRDTRS